MWMTEETSDKSCGQSRQGERAGDEAIRVSKGKAEDKLFPVGPESREQSVNGKESCQRQVPEQRPPEG